MCRIFQIFLDELGDSKLVVHIEGLGLVFCGLLKIRCRKRPYIGDFVRRLVILEVFLHSSQFLLDDDQTVIYEGRSISCRTVLVLYPMLVIYIYQCPEHSICPGRETVLHRKHDNGGFLSGQRHCNALAVCFGQLCGVYPADTHRLFPLVNEFRRDNDNLAYRCRYGVAEPSGDFFCMFDSFTGNCQILDHECAVFFIDNLERESGSVVVSCKHECNRRIRELFSRTEELLFHV